MRREIAVALIGVAIAFGPAALAEIESPHRVILPQDIKWQAGPPSLPAGAQAALLYGDPAKEGLFALRVKIPKDYYIPPHTHPQAEVVTVLSGKFSLGMGAKADRAATHPVGSGGFVSLPARVAHYVFSEEETVLQITSVGPWDINYVDPKDDPRLNIAPAGKSGAAQR